MRRNHEQLMEVEESIESLIFGNFRGIQFTKYDIARMYASSRNVEWAVYNERMKVYNDVKNAINSLIAQGKVREIGSVPSDISPWDKKLFEVVT